MKWFMAGCGLILAILYWPAYGQDHMSVYILTALAWLLLLLGWGCFILGRRVARRG